MLKYWTAVFFGLFRLKNEPPELLCKINAPAEQQASALFCVQASFEAANLVGPSLGNPRRMSKKKKKGKEDIPSLGATISS